MTDRSETQNEFVFCGLITYTVSPNLNKPARVRPRRNLTAAGLELTATVLVSYKRHLEVMVDEGHAH